MYVKKNESERYCLMLSHNTRLILDKRQFVVLSLTLLSITLLLNLENTFFTIFAIDNNDDKSQSKDFNLVVASDFNCKNDAQKTIDNMIDEKPELILALGDLSNQKSGSCWIDMFPKKYLDNVKVSMGFNEVKSSLGGPKQVKKYLKTFGLDKQYYSFDYNNVHFLALATEIPNDEKSKQYKFVKNDLQKTSQDKDIDWIIVYGYRNFYSSDSKHDGNGGLQSAYHPLFDKYGVDIVLSGHNHNYQRTFPIEYNDDKRDKPTVTEREKKSYDARDKKNPIFITVGTGGAGLYPLHAKADYVVTQIKAHGFLEIEFTEDTFGQILKGNFHKNSGNEIVDSFILFK
ncbi:MAG: hypothetical protein DA328_02330 [Nitrososphaeraceae archaeon]|nr:hypothetical protein [Nitrososphaeraceae archaeon]